MRAKRLDGLEKFGRVGKVLKRVICQDTNNVTQLVQMGRRREWSTFSLLDLCAVHRSQISKCTVQIFLSVPVLLLSFINQFALVQ